MTENTMRLAKSAARHLQTKTLARALAVLLAAAVGPSLCLADERVDRLSEELRTWLEEEVVYIITDRERDVFLNLETLEERQGFVGAFWERRDPNAATLENEFKIEHYRRFDYANRILGRDAPMPGWRTDQGRFYIKLGEPAEIQRYDGLNELVTMQLWIYTGDAGLGVPARFNLLFFKNNDIGEYRLYHPWSDGPERLLRGGESYRANQNLAVDLIETVSMDLARASLTVDMTENMSHMLAGRNSIDPQLLTVRPSMSVDLHLANIEESPYKRVDTGYLDGYLNYGDRVSADYSFKFVANRAFFAVLHTEAGVPFVHYSIEIEPKDFSLERSEDSTQFYTTLDVDLEVRTKAGLLVAVQHNQPFLQLSVSDMDAARAFPFAYRDNFPVLPGEYQVSVILKNRATKQYTVAEETVVVPEIPVDTPVLGQLILAYNRDLVSTEVTGYQTFQFQGIAFDPAVDQTFIIGSNIEVVAQHWGADSAESVRYRLMAEDGSTIHEQSSLMSDGVLLETIPLLKVEGARYTLHADLLDAQGESMASQSVRLHVSPRSEIGRPAFVYRHSFNADVPGFLSMSLGSQHMAKGELEEAEKAFRGAVEANNPDLAIARWKLASVLLFSKEADEALELLLPIKDDYANQVEVVEGIGFAYYVKKAYTQAVPFLQHATTLRPPDTSLLNALGDSYQRLGNADEAKAVFERSLEINPEQEGVKSRLSLLGDGAAP